MTTIKSSGRDLELKSDQDIVFYPTSNIWISQGTKLIFEGTVPDDYEVKLQATSVTADRDIILLCACCARLAVLFICQKYIL